MKIDTTLAISLCILVGGIVYVYISQIIPENQGKTCFEWERMDGRFGRMGGRKCVRWSE
jgi:hypothetical protein